jgi:hypothetical protein
VCARACADDGQKGWAVERTVQHAAAIHYPDALLVGHELLVGAQVAIRAPGDHLGARSAVKAKHLLDAHCVLTHRVRRHAVHVVRNTTQVQALSLDKQDTQESTSMP